MKHQIECDELKEEVKRLQEENYQLEGKIIVLKADVRTWKEKYEWANQAASQFLHAADHSNGAV